MSSKADAGLVLAVGKPSERAALHLQESRGWGIAYTNDLVSAARLIENASARVAVVLITLPFFSIRDCLTFSDLVSAIDPPRAIALLLEATSDGLTELAARIREEPHEAGERGTDAVLIDPESAEMIRGIPLKAIGNGHGVSRTEAEEFRTSTVGYLIGHSNGHDAGFGSTVLCRRDEASATVNEIESAAMPCYFGQGCRFDAQYLRVSPGSLACSKLVNITCWGISSSELFFSPSLSVGQAFMEAPGTRTMLTFVRAAAIDAEELRLIHSLINGGLPFGIVASRVNKFRLRRGSRADLICFGDPMSHVNSTNIHGTVVWIDECHGNIELQEGLTSPTTHFVKLPLNVDGLRHVALLSASPEDITYGVMDVDQLFLMPYSRTRREVQVRLLPIDSQELMNLSSVRQLAPHLLDLEDIATKASEHIGAKHSVEQLRIHLSQLRDLLMEWPFRDVKAGDVLLTHSILEAYTRLTRQLVATVTTCFSVFVDTLDRGGTFFMRRNCEIGSHLSIHFEQRTCAYCGLPVDEQILTNEYGEKRRITGICYGCGPIYDTFPNGPCWLHCTADPSAGSSVAFSLQVRNPFAFPVNAHVLVALPRFGQHGDQVWTTQVIELRDDIEQTVLLELKLPDTSPRGVYYVIGLVLIGAAVCFFRRLIRVQQRTAVRAD